MREWNEKRNINILLEGPEEGVESFEQDGRTYKLTYSVFEIEDKRLYREADWLKEEYLSKRRTLKSIADQFGLTPMSIHKWLRKHGIDTRPPGRFASLD